MVCGVRGRVKDNPTRIRVDGDPRKDVREGPVFVVQRGLSGEVLPNVKSVYAVIDVYANLTVECAWTV